MRSSEEFERLTAPLRRELVAHCYRMTGAAGEAEDLVQETYLRPWGSYARFEGRSSLRSWLYRIATNVCLKAIERHGRRPLPAGLGLPGDNPEGPVAAARVVAWLQPFPGPVNHPEPDHPAAVVASRAGMQLALIASQQYRPPGGGRYCFSATCWTGPPQRPLRRWGPPPPRSTARPDQAGRTLFLRQQHTFQMAACRSKDAADTMRRLADWARPKPGRDHKLNHSRRRWTMRKLIESTLVSLDGVIEAPERWANFDAEATAYSLEQLDNYDAFVMGRVTYERFFANWGHTAGNPYIDRINAMPKHVASRSLTETAWNATLLGPDPASAIDRLKNQPGKDLIKYGTTRFDDTLVGDHLIDEFRFWIMPVVVGSGQRLFQDVDTSKFDLRLTDEKRLENGSVILTYTPG